MHLLLPLILRLGQSVSQYPCGEMSLLTIPNNFSKLQRYLTYTKISSNLFCFISILAKLLVIYILLFFFYFFLSLFFSLSQWMPLLKDQHIKEHIIYGQWRMSEETDSHKKGCFLSYIHSLLLIQIDFPWSDFFLLLKQIYKLINK